MVVLLLFIEIVSEASDDDNIDLQGGLNISLGPNLWNLGRDKSRVDFEAFSCPYGIPYSPFRYSSKSHGCEVGVQRVLTNACLHMKIVSIFVYIYIYIYIKFLPHDSGLLFWRYSSTLRMAHGPWSSHPLLCFIVM